MSNTSKTKYYWYVLVLSAKGPKFVTKIGEHHTAYWEANEKPLAMSKEWCKDMSIGLTWNGNPAYSVCVTYEITEQPFMYEKGRFEWHWDEQPEA